MSQKRTKQIGMCRVRRGFHLDPEIEFNRNGCRLWNFEVSGWGSVPCSKVAICVERSQVALKHSTALRGRPSALPVLITILGTIKHPLN